MAGYGLTAEDGMAKAWYLDQGHVSGGAEAINAAMRLIWWAKPFSYLYRLPGLRHIQDWIYQWVADNRHRMPGGTAECEIEPGTSE